jgi:uncharacterized cupredoxin-like copper-binding protein
MEVSMKTTSLAALVAVAVLVAAPMSGLAATSRTRTTHVRVIMGKPGTFEFVLSKKRVPKGKVIFKLVNKGQIAHDFAIHGKKSKKIQPAKTGSLTVRFRRAGRYPYKCTVPGHAEAGMKGVLKVY